MPENIPIHTDPAAFDGMRKAGQLAAAILDRITPHVTVGAVTEELDKLIHDDIIANGATPATLGYKGYTHSSCISINHVVCHGIPSERKLKDGDIVNIDVTVILDGWFGDTSRMFIVGDRAPVIAKKLVEVTYDCLMRGIEVVKPGATLGDIGYAIQSYAEQHRFSVVRDFCGHGLGRVFHCPPQVVHYGIPGEGTVLEAGMFFTIEPMINVGTWQTRILKDGWTAVTKDRKLTAQFEHSLAVTDDGFEIFTESAAGYTKPPYK